MPALRMKMLELWQPGRPFHEATRMTMLANGQPPEDFSMTFDPAGLARCRLWYATEAVTELVDRSAKTLPPTTLCDDLVPVNWGLVVFARPLIGTDCQTGLEIPIRALLWGVTRYLPLPGGYSARYGLYANEECEHEPDGLERAVTISCYRHYPEYGDWGPTGRSDWRWMTDTQAQTSELHTQRQTDSMAEERRWLAALWLLSSQPLLSANTVKAPKAERRRQERAGATQSTDVREIDVRQRPRPERDEESGGRQVDWSCRWIVGGEDGGFWRQQPYGPGQSLRRPVWIAPFVKGPADKPLKVRDEVHVVRASPAERN